MIAKFQKEPNKIQLELLSNYKDKILGVRNYKSNKSEFYTTDLTDRKALVLFLNEVDTGESDISPAGKVFLEKYYGDMRQVAKIKAKKEASRFGNSRTEKRKMIDECYDWLMSIEPMSTKTFIEQGRGNIDENSKLNERLLPPK